MSSYQLVLINLVAGILLFDFLRGSKVDMRF